MLKMMFILIVYILSIVSPIVEPFPNFLNKNSKTVYYANFINSNSQDMLTIEEIESFASLSKIKIRSIITGPYLKLEALTQTDNSVIGYCTAFIRPFPFKLFHLDTIQVSNRRQNLGYKRKGSNVHSAGLSFIMGTWALIWARQHGCTTTELLAVRDNDKMNAILVRLYSSFGFQIKREVKEDSIADRLVWGAVGTLMEMNINSFFTEWTPQVRDMLRIKNESFAE